MSVEDGAVLRGDGPALDLFFPAAGPAASGHSFDLPFEGSQTIALSRPTTPARAQTLVKSAAMKSGSSYGLEAAIPARAFPRFPARGPLLLELCVSYSGRTPLQDGGVQPDETLTTCPGGQVLGGPVQLPEAFRRALGVNPPKQVLTLEGRAGGWLGYGELPSPTWVQADSPLTQQSLGRLVAGKPVDPRAAGVNVPGQLRLPDGRLLYSVLSGSDPYARGGQCNAALELRVGLFLVKGNSAKRVLDWPASSCGLGRLLSMELADGDSDVPGALTLGYSSGASVNFAWSGDHFERTELGSR